MTKFWCTQRFVEHFAHPHGLNVDKTGLRRRRRRRRDEGECVRVCMSVCVLERERGSQPPECLCVCERLQHNGPTKLKGNNF